MPHMARMPLQDTQISGGHISTTAKMPDGKEASVDMYSAAQFDKPGAPHNVVQASDGSSWYQMASGDGAGAFYGTPDFSGDPSEAAQVAAAFPNMPEGTMLRTVDDDVLEASAPDGSTSMMYSAGHYDEPGGPHETISASDGMQWYSMAAHADTPSFEPEFGYSSADFPGMAEGTDLRSAGNGVLEARAPDGGMSMMYNSACYSACYEEPGTAHDTVSSSDGGQWQREHIFVI